MNSNRILTPSRLALLACLAAPAQADDLGARIASSGTPAGVPACATCHAANGGGSEDDAFPRLAGLGAAYMTRQIHAFKEGGRGHPIMRPWAELLSDADIAAVSAYYAALPPASNAKAPEDIATHIGRALVTVGDWADRALPACEQCHAPDGLGLGDTFPALAGQPYSYLLGQIEAWTLGNRTGDVNGLMTPIALQLSRDEGKSLAAYYAALPVAPKPATASPVRPGLAALDLDKAGADATPPRDQGPVRPGRAPGREGTFMPPARGSAPSDRMGDAIRLGEAIFTHTSTHPVSAPYVGNSQTCEGCHLDAGRLADSAPMWAAWVAYPAFRTKDQRVNTLEERIQGCFTYSMNAPASAAGRAPEADSETLAALLSYIYWLASGAPTGDHGMPGRGYPALGPPAKGLDPKRGSEVYQVVCAVCHGADGQGAWARGHLIFPPLWGPESYNWGAGMHRIDTAAAFIKRNMPLGLAAGLSDQDAWNLAAFINAHERPQDPRFNGNLAETAAQYHAGEFDTYGKPGLDGRLLGSGSPAP